MFSNLTIAQGTDSRSLMSKQKKLFVEFTIDPALSDISYSNILITSEISSSNPLSVSGLVEAGYYFTPFTALVSGLGYSNFRKTYSLEEYTTSFVTADSEDEDFEMRIIGQHIKEDQVLHLFRVPLSLEGRFMFSEKLGLTASGGLNFYFPISCSYTSSGTFSYAGYYAAYPVLLEDIPQYGFPSNLEMQAKEKLETASVIMALQASGGVSWKVSSSLSVLLQVHYLRSISEVSDYEALSEYHLTTQPEELNSLMEACENIGISGYGIKVSLRYYLK